jgi:hypothetical protein
MTKFGNREEISKIKRSIIEVENEDVMNEYEIEVDYTEVSYEHKTEILKVRAVDEETAKEEAWYEVEEHIAEGDEVECDNTTVLSTKLHKEEWQKDNKTISMFPNMPQVIHAKA